MKTLCEQLNFKSGENLSNTEAMEISIEDAIQQSATIIKDLCQFSGLLLSDIDDSDFDSACILLEDYAKASNQEDVQVITIWIN